MKAFTTESVKEMRSLRADGFSWGEVKAHFRDLGFSDDDTVNIIWSTHTTFEPTALMVAIAKVNGINHRRRAKGG